MNLQKALKYFSLAGAQSFLVMKCGMFVDGWVGWCTCVGSHVGAHSFPL